MWRSACLEWRPRQEGKSLNDYVISNRVCYVKDVFAGILKETEAGYSFAYDADYLKFDDKKEVSLTLPLREKPYFSKNLFPFFDGLIPEGWLLGVVSKNWKIDSNDRFGLLLVSCKDCIGDVSILEGQI